MSWNVYICKCIELYNLPQQLRYKLFGEFPGSLVVGTLSSHCQGLGSVSVPGTKIPSALKCSLKILKIKK